MKSKVKIFWKVSEPTKMQALQQGIANGVETQ